ncbi:GH10103 [Drosophila grimshawi]|uniref:GH10103 n=1 Tax=Drosophila grimshawi TaxID=7222 RepID=B4JCQ8_DROGR|nr:GH10103 [Drosophila grimshawi]
MGLLETLRRLTPGSPSRGSCNIELQHRVAGDNSSSSKIKTNLAEGPARVAPLAQVTEQSLQVWRTLPAEIRHDPSMASFQMENERIHGSTACNSEAEPEPEAEAAEHDIDLGAIDLEPEEDVASRRLQLQLQDAPGSSYAGSDFLDIKMRPSGEGDKSTDDEATTTHSEHEPHANGPGNAKSQARRIHHRSKRSKEQLKRDKHWKRSGLLVLWLFTAAVLITVGEKHLLEKIVQVPRGEPGKFFQLQQKPTGDFRLRLLGPFKKTSTLLSENKEDSNETITPNFLFVQPQISQNGGNNGSQVFKNILEPWQLALVPEAHLPQAAAVARNRTFHVNEELQDQLSREDSKLRLHIHSNVEQDLAIELNYNPVIVNTRTGSILAGIILLLFYGLLVWEQLERPFVAMICSILSVTALAVLQDRPNMDEMKEWMDMELLTLLFCMMLLILILTETGIFDYLAVICFEISGGKIWPMIYSLCLVTCLVSSMLDNMTTVLLLTPVAIRLCEVMQLDPIPVVMGIIVHANIGGALSPIGDPISIIISTNHFIMDNGINFFTFVAHMLPGVLLAALQSCGYLRLYYRNIDTLRLNEPKELRELRREIRVWQRAMNAIAACSKDAQLVRGTLHGKVKQLKRTLRRRQQGVASTEIYANTLDELKQKYPIKSMKLLLQSSGALIFVIVCFLVQSVPHWRTLPLGWVALLGVILLLIVLNREDMEHLIHRVEWTTLLFFAAMFVMMECVERLGLLVSIAELTEHVILAVNEQHRLTVAIFMILWTSALASSVLDSIPVAAMMVKLVNSLVAKESLGLPLQPLVWSLTLGASLGGNGSLYGASANVIAAGIAEQHGYKLSFTRYLRTMLPMMLGQVTLMTIYLMLSHVVFNWD